MRIRTTPLLCELHAHTTWSDGALGLAELVDLYGRSGFDVLAVTDHTVRTDEDEDEVGPRHVHAGTTPRTSTRSAARSSAPGPSTTCSSCPGSS